MLELRIERLSKLGDGVAMHDGRSVFVAGALPGETVEAELEVDGRILRGRLARVLKKSHDRREAVCPHFGACGGCDWQHLAEEAQRAAKEEIVLSALEHVGGIARESIERLPTIRSPADFAYRRRAVMRFGDKRLGFYQRASHDLVPIDECATLVAPLATIAPGLSEHLAPMAREVESVAALAEGGRSSISVHLRGPVRAFHRELAQRALKPDRLSGAVLVPRAGSPVLLGKPVLRADCPRRPELSLFLRPDAFVQANVAANGLLVDAVVGAMGARDGDGVLELFSGNGNFTFALAGRARQLVAVESSGVSVELAQRTVREGSVANVRLVQGEAAKVCRGLMAEGLRFDLLLLDPPRTGAPGAGRWARELGVRRVVYVACDAAALARDAAELAAAGFRPSTLQLVDLFPQTRHLEAVMAFDAGSGGG